MSKIMASHILLFLAAALFSITFASKVSPESSFMYPFACSKSSIKTCNASLYHIDYGLDKEQISTFYNINTSQINPIFHGNKQDYLISSLPCSCKDVNSSTAYFYDTSYVVQQNDTFINVSTQIYSGQAFDVGESLIVGNKVAMHLLCGCLESESQIIVTYTVQQNDTLSDIASLLSANVSDIVRMNRNLIPNPDIIDVGWVLFVPTDEDGIPAPGPK
ncbi:hypothetical protein REPUB_Repub15cG0109600 [Reevesia pubescens]